MIDSIRATRELLTLEPAVTSLVASKIFGGRLPRNLDPPFRAIVLTTVGGVAELYVPLISPVVQVDCWSDVSGEEAREIYRAVHDVLHGRENVSLTEGFLAAAVEESQGQDLVDPETGWFRVLSFYRLTFRKEG